MRINLMPIAGEGKRFAREGYKIPKPFILIDGKPMFIKAAECLPRADSNIFICKKEHRKMYQIDNVIKKYIPNSTIIEINSSTRGQAETCLYAQRYCDKNAQLTIGACDNGMIYSDNMFNSLTRDKKTDTLVWTFRGNPIVLKNPQYWGWVKVGKNNLINKVSVKNPLSTKTIEEHCIVGCFTFKNASTFFNNAQWMIEHKRQINDEYYVDESINVLIEKGKQVKVFEIDTYIGWGTPEYLKTYNYWSTFFNKKNKNQ